MGGEVPNICTDEADLLILTIVHLNSYMMLISNHQSTNRALDIWNTMTANKKIIFCLRTSSVVVVTYRLSLE